MKERARVLWEIIMAMKLLWIMVAAFAEGRNYDIFPIYFMPVISL